MARERRKGRGSVRGLAAALALGLCAALSPAAGDELGIDLSDTPLPLLTFGDLPSRAGPLIEIGRGINESGPLSEGIELPTGAVWQPALWIYGSQRIALLTTDGNRRTRPGGDRSEIMTRMDLFANLQLAGTERVLVHVRPMDRSGQFAGRVLGPSSAESDWNAEWDAEIETLFFEGDVGEMFPLMDLHDSGSGDFGLVVGRFPVEFQNGYLVRDEMTAVGLAQADVQMEGSSGLRIAGLWAFDHINEPTGMPDNRDVDLFGLFVEGDFPWGLLELDVAGTVAGEERGKQINAGVGWTGHIAGNNYSVHANVSNHYDQSAEVERVKDFDGALLVAGYSTEVNLRRDLLYANGYWAEGDYGRVASNGTPPLGPVGLSFAGVGLGGYRPALWPRPLDSAGFAVGWQMFFNEERTNWVIELAHRQDFAKDNDLGDTSGLARDTSGLALTTRVQQKIFEHLMLQLDAYYALHSSDDLGPQDAESDDDSAAIRLELRVNF